MVSTDNLAASSNDRVIHQRPSTKWRSGMKRLRVTALSCIILLASGGSVAAQVAGSTRRGVAVEEMRMVAKGWSAKKQILRQPVYNEQTQKVGIIDDLIIAPDTMVSFVIIGARGFVGVGRHDVAI